MSTLSALLVLGQCALLNGSWWVAKAFHGDGSGAAQGIVWASLITSLAGATPELATAVAGYAQLANAAHAAGLLSVAGMAVSQASLGVVAGMRAVKSLQERRRLAAAALLQLAHGDAAFAEGRHGEALASYQAQVSSAQAAGDFKAIRMGLTRVGWVDYITGRVEQARTSAGWAAGGGELDGELGSAVVLLAGCLAMGSGRLDVARPAVEDAVRMADEADDSSLAALARVALGCVHYLEGWSESGRQYVEAHLSPELRLFDRQVAGALLVGLSMAARHRGRRPDAVAFAERAAMLLAGNAELEALAEHALRPESSPWLESPARNMMALVLPIAAGALSG
jgi:hypothetical protein